MKLNLEIETNCVGCLLKYLRGIGDLIHEQVTVPVERPEDRDPIHLEYECDIACDGYSGAVTLGNADDEGANRERDETWEEVAQMCSLSASWWERHGNA